MTSAAAEHAPRTVVVAVLTYQRPDDLAEVVPALVEQLEDVAANARVLVVDNAPVPSERTVATITPASDVSYLHEPAPGIASARNRAIDESLQAGADALVFIDDDERPEPGWLRHLLGAWNATGAAAVVGPVLSAYPRDPEPWIREGGFFERRRFPTGTVVTVAATNNLLLDLGQVTALGLRFDPVLGASGGSDTLFTRQLHRAGGRIVWCDEARVIDVVPADRLTRRWVLRKALRTGNSWSRVALMLEPGSIRRTARRLELTFLGCVRIGAGSARLAYGTLARSVRHQARGARTLARGAGMAGGAWGYTYAEYRRPPEHP